MTNAAWMMLVVTWSVIVYFCGRFFIKVLRTPTLHRADDHRPEIFAKDA
jgi:hypothetical protein